MKYLLSIVNYSVLAALSVLVGLLLTGIVPALVGWESYVVPNGSMEPALQRGDLLVVAPVPSGLLQAGDLIVYRTPDDPGTVNMHRLDGVSAGSNGRLSLQTRLDTSATSEPVLAAPESMLGRVALTIPRLGLLVEFVAQPLGRVVLLVLPGVLLGLDALRARRRPVQPSSVEAEANAQRVTSLLAFGRRALDSGHPELAVRAADGVLALSPANTAAWQLKALVVATLKAKQGHVAA